MEETSGAGSANRMTSRSSMKLRTLSGSNARSADCASGTTRDIGAE